MSAFLPSQLMFWEFFCRWAENPGMSEFRGLQVFSDFPGSNLEGRACSLEEMIARHLDCSSWSDFSGWQQEGWSSSMHWGPDWPSMAWLAACLLLPILGMIWVRNFLTNLTSEMGSSAILMHSRLLSISLARYSAEVEWWWALNSSATGTLLTLLSLDSLMLSMWLGSVPWTGQGTCRPPPLNIVKRTESYVLRFGRIFLEAFPPSHIHRKQY